MGYPLYNILILLASPIVVLIMMAKRRCRRGLLQRLGRVPLYLKNRDGPVVWVHAVSLGEVTAAIPLIKALHQRFPNWTILVSTVTETGREAVEERLDGIAHHFYCPLDFPWAVNAYVREVRPVAFLVVETELWPNLLRSISRLHVPTILVNGRLSSNSFQRYLMIPGFMKEVLSTLTLCLMQSERDSQRMIRLGADPKRVYNSGNMKFDLVDEAGDVCSSMISPSQISVTADEKLIIAGSTHCEEEDQLLRCYQRLCESLPRLVLLIAPRHIERTNKVEEKILTYGFPCLRKSQIKSNTAMAQSNQGPRVIILDTRGELSSIYSLGWIAFVGGTLTPIGGHNLLEPASWGKPVFFGPYTDHCEEVSRLLREGGGGIQVQNEDEFYEKVKRAYNDESWIQRAGKAAYDVLQAHRGVVKKNLEHICASLDSCHF